MSKPQPHAPLCLAPTAGRPCTCRPEVQVARDALRTAGLSDLADRLEWAVDAVIKQQEKEAKDAASLVARELRLSAADDMRRLMLQPGALDVLQHGEERATAMRRERFAALVHQTSGQHHTRTQCGARWADLGNFAVGGTINCPACLHVLFGPGTDGR